jgi:hypothetical protein
MCVRLHVCMCVHELYMCAGGCGVGTTQPVPCHVSQKGHKVFTGENGLHLALNQHLNTQLNVICRESTRGTRITLYKICFYLLWNVQ